MKNVFLILCTLLAFTLTGCNKYDDGKLKDQLAEHDRRISSLEQLVQALDAQMKAQARISSVTPLSGTPGGWRIAFEGGTLPSIDILNGERGAAGPQGPQGSSGPRGPQGEAAAGAVLEVNDNDDGTITIVLNDANDPHTSYTFAKASASLAARLEVLSLGEVAIKEGMSAPIKFRVNPSNATVPTDLALWSLDEVTTLSSYVTASDYFSLTSIEADGEKEGQYVATVRCDFHEGDTYAMALVLNAGSEASPVYVSSAPFKLITDAGLIRFASKAAMEPIELDADDTDGGKIEFTAAADWTAAVEFAESAPLTLADEPTEAPGEDPWLTLDKESGNSGPIELELTLLPNETGAERRATIVITSGEDEDEVNIPIEVIQSATPGQPEEPETYAITPDGELENGSVVAKVDDLEADQAEAGTMVTLEADPDENYVLYRWVVTGVESGDEIPVVAGEFEMPEEEIEISAEFVLETDVRTIAFDDMTNGRVRLEYEPNLLGENKVLAGENIQLIAEPEDDYQLKEWKVLKSDQGEVELTGDNDTFEMPDDDVTIQAEFEAIEPQA